MADISNVLPLKRNVIRWAWLSLISVGSIAITNSTGFPALAYIGGWISCTAFSLWWADGWRPFGAGEKEGHRG